MESAYDWAMDQFYAGGLSAEEIKTCVLSGLSTVTLIREAIKQHEAERAAIEAENAAFDACCGTEYDPFRK